MGPVNDTETELPLPNNFPLIFHSEDIALVLSERSFLHK